MGTAWLKELEVATAAARKAAEIALRLQPGITAETKSDNSPVTQADRECEREIAQILHDAFPDDGVLGEEGARAESRSGRRWIIDPIDGTRDYVRGTPLWANLIALESGGEVVVGVVNLPVLGNLYTATRGGGAHRDGTAMRVSSKKTIEEAVLFINEFRRLDRFAFKPKLLDWMARFWAVRGMGGAPDAMLVASGHAEICIEPKAAAWDFAPLKVIAEEAGARFMNFDGGSSIDAGNAVIFAPAFEAEVKGFLGI